MTHSHDHNEHHHDQVHLASVLDLDAKLLGDHVDDAAAAISRSLGRAPQRIVDLGAGTGTGTEALARNFADAQLLAVDSSTEMAALVEQRAAAGGFAARVATVVADLDDGLPPLHSPDVLWASMSLHHLADPTALLRAAASVLAPGGVVAIIEMDGLPRFTSENSELRGIEDRCHAAAATAGWEALVDWTDALDRAGHDVLERRTIRVGPGGPSQAVARYARHWFGQFRHRLADVLDPADLSVLDELIDERSPRSVHRRTDLTFTAGRHLWITRPRSAGLMDAPSDTRPLESELS
ncbi:hypothetical protein GONAM_22_00340 [Gordonia namibiensis NBRC 108229]|uniref:Methyltransferase domain-containing protein n=1 Tax=Gordonia namibiensis NBRC 108229 TaxID=1208314 RepID=K6VXT0_9ACTN|nr:class I SAM-dependent methyltransferase [Gordonia namibiensis]GAC01059.1 hypothetical protein GONAM_22_00340 [Gordonia namibiensis NBRC 108229]